MNILVEKVQDSGRNVSLTLSRFNTLIKFLESFSFNEKYPEACYATRLYKKWSTAAASHTLSPLPLRLVHGVYGARVQPPMGPISSSGGDSYSCLSTICYVLAAFLDNTDTKT